MLPQSSGRLLNRPSETASTAAATDPGRGRPASLFARVLGRAERGAGTVKYIGLAVVVSVIIAGLVAVPWMPEAKTGVQAVICSIFSKGPGGAPGSCASVLAPPMTEADYTPECLMSDEVKTRGSKAKILFIDLGSNVKAQVKTYSDGRTTVTLLDEYSGGAAFDLGKLKLGKAASINLGANAKLTYGNGDTWEFDNPEDAQKLINEINDYANSNWNYVPIIGPAVLNKPDDPRITYDSFTFGAGADANVGLNNPFGKGKQDQDGGSGDGGSSSGGSGSTGSGSSGDGTGGKDKETGVTKLKPGLDIGAGATYGDTVIVQTDRGDDLDSPDDDTKTYITSVSMGAEAHAGIADAKAGANANTQGQIAVTTDADGNITKVQLANTRNGDGGVGADYDDKNPSVYSTTLDVKTDADRKTVSDWLANPMNIDPVGLIAGPPMPEENGNLSPFEQLLHDRAVMQQEEFAGDLDNNDFGIGLKVMGIGLGWDRTDQDETKRNTASYYWGAPDANGVRHKTDNPKC